MHAPQWWERLVAAIIDGLVLLIPAVLINLLFGLMLGSSMILNVLLVLVASLIIIAGVVAYKVLLEGGPKQATLGKMVFGLQVVNLEGGKPNRIQAIIRTWPWWLGLLNIFSPIPVLGILVAILVVAAFIGVFVTVVLSPHGQGIHDKTANCYVIKASDGLIAGMQK
jgi:uncharacterized RDD family membrane protein YckC